MKRTHITAIAIAAITLPLLAACTPTGSPEDQYLAFVASEGSGSLKESDLLFLGEEMCKTFEANGVQMVAIAAEMAREESQGDLPVVVEGAALYLCPEFADDYNQMGQ